MDDVAKKDEVSLYERDFYSWTQAQSQLLRQGRLSEVDAPNLAEEIETLGRKEVSELRSRYTVLVLHLLKTIHQPAKAGRSWAASILNQRIEIARHIQDNPSLKSKADELFDEAYADARRLAAAETGIDLDVFPLNPPFTREQVVDQLWRP